MSNPACSDEEFINLFERYGPTKVSKLLNVSIRSVFIRRSNLEIKLGRELKVPEGNPNSTRLSSTYEQRKTIELQNGIILVGSDAHYWPEVISPAHRGLCLMSKELKPKAIILNGDVADFPKVSRHPPIGWSKPPTVQEEIEAIDDRTQEIREAAGYAELYWTIGNHDLRFESRLAMNAGEYEGVKGTRLPDHFPNWTFCWSIWVNDLVVIKHRFKGGIHATHNNTLWAGKTMVTGHLHSLKVTPFDDYNGTRYGVDTGTLNDPHGEHADYTEDNPLNHRSGFIVLTFHKGRLLLPEIAAVVDDKHIQFRGQLIKV